MGAQESSGTYGGRLETLRRTHKWSAARIAHELAADGIRHDMCGIQQVAGLEYTNSTTRLILAHDGGAAEPWPLGAIEIIRVYV